MSDQQKTPVVRTRAELRTEMRRRFGNNPMDWAYQCCECGLIFTTRANLNLMCVVGWITENELLMALHEPATHCPGQALNGQGCGANTLELPYPDGVEYLVEPDGSKLAHFPIAPAPEKQVQP